VAARLAYRNDARKSGLGSSLQNEAMKNCHKAGVVTFMTFVTHFWDNRPRARVRAYYGNQRHDRHDRHSVSPIVISRHRLNCDASCDRFSNHCAGAHALLNVLFRDIDKLSLKNFIHRRQT
jgi:hypothetical protein